MSGSIFYGQLMAFNKRVQILGLPRILLGKADFVLLIKAQITRKKINLPKSFFVNYVRACARSSVQYFILLQKWQRYICTVYRRKGAYPFKTGFSEPYPLQKRILSAKNNLNATQWHQKVSKIINSINCMK